MSNYTLIFNSPEVETWRVVVVHVTNVGCKTDAYEKCIERVKEHFSSLTCCPTSRFDDMAYTAFEGLLVPENRDVTFTI